MDTVAAPLQAATNYPTNAHVGAMILGVRAARVEEPRLRCYLHGFFDEDGYAPAGCRGWCRDASEEPYAGAYLEAAIHELTYRDRDAGHDKWSERGLHAAARRMREATRRAMVREAREERDDDLRARAEG